MKLRVAKKVLKVEASKRHSFRLSTFKKASRRVNWNEYCIHARKALGIK